VTTELIFEFIDKLDRLYLYVEDGNPMLKQIEETGLPVYTRRCIVPTVYCTKYGIRGFSKNPHSRSVFTDLPLEMELLDNFINVLNTSPKDENGQPAHYTGGEHEGEIVVKHEVYFETYADTGEAAIKRVLEQLQRLLSGHVNLDVASCLHEFEIMPGEHSSVDGYVGPEATVPPDPFAKSKEKRKVSAD
jgi:hypothetical protein